MLGWELPPHNSGGLGVASFGLGRALVKHGVNLIFLLPQKIGLVPTPFPVLFANDYELSTNSYSPYLTQNQWGFSDLLTRVFTYAARAKAISPKLKFSIIHAHDWLCIPAGLAIKDASGKPLIIHVHATEFDRSGGSNVNSTVYQIERRGFEAADLVITVSGLTRDILIHKYGIPPQKVRVVHNGIDASDYPASSSPVTFLQALKAQGYKIVLFMGRITLQKGPDYFLLAAKKVLEHYPSVLFVIAGSGDMEPQIINQAVTLGISDRVLFPGFMRGEQQNQLYKSADLFVLPSVSEPFGLVPLESIVNGTPVLISKQSGVSEVLSHALKVDFWDTDEMANQILSVLNYPSLPITLQRESQAEVQKLSWSAAADKVTDIYDHL